MDPIIVIRALVYAAYELGWRNACDDHLEQQRDPDHPIGESRHMGVGSVLVDLDPNDLLRLQGGKT
jgi:hypothetical protein